MGLTGRSTGAEAIDNGLIIKKQSESDKIIALAGNPNVGKSTLFNELTGMNQHTGNWPGKTVANAQGCCSYNGVNYIFVDIPGSYSLFPHSAEEEVAGDFICSGIPDAVAVVCSASCLQRNMNLVMQIAGVTENIIICLNLMDEAEKKGISVDYRLLEERLGIPVVPMCARNGVGKDEFLKELEKLVKNGAKIKYHIKYNPEIEKAAELNGKKGFNALRELDGFDEENDGVKYLLSQGIDAVKYRDMTACATIEAADELCRDIIDKRDSKSDKRDRRLDRLFTSRKTGFLIMGMLLISVFWITIVGANIPSNMLNGLFTDIEVRLLAFFEKTEITPWIYEMLILGMYRVVAWVVSVMLPPMAIFFPLFTILEDSGYLPRVAFNLDKCFRKCRTCGKQALTMCQRNKNSLGNSEAKFSTYRLIFFDKCNCKADRYRTCCDGLV